MMLFVPDLGKVVFIIREDFAKDFKEIFEPKLKGKIAVDYVYQDYEKLHRWLYCSGGPH
jgi:hypothetical protein